MSKGNVDLAIRLLSNSMEVGVLALNKETIDLLKVKHPVEKGGSEDTKLHGPLPTVENIISDVIDDSVFSGDGENRGVSGPSGLIQMAGDESWY